MKLTHVFLAGAALLSSIGFSEERQVETLADTLNLNSNTSHGGMGAPVVKYTSILGRPGNIIGGRGAWIVDHSYMLGGGAYGMTSDRQVEGKYVSFGYATLMAGYTMWSERLIHPVFLANLGVGNIRSETQRDDEVPEIDSNMSIVEPEILVETNVFKHAKVAVGGSYRIATGVSGGKVSNREMSGWAITSAVNIGAF